MAYKTYDLHTVFWMLFQAGYEDAGATGLARLVMALGAINRDNGMTSLSDETFQITCPKAVPGHELVVWLDKEADFKVVIRAASQEEVLQYFTLISNHNRQMMPSNVAVSVRLKNPDDIKSNEELAPLVVTDYYCRRVVAVALEHGFMLSDDNKALDQLSCLAGIPLPLNLTLHIPATWNASLVKDSVNRYSSGLF